MASTYVNDLRLNEMATGDGSGTWGTTTNLNLEMIAEKFGAGSEALSDASTATITMADGASDAFRSLALTLTGSLSQACTVTLAPNTISNVWMVKNSAGDAVTLTQGTGANVVIPNGFTKVVYSDGAGAGAAVVDVFDDLSIGPNLRVGNAAAEDTAIVFDGNAQDYYIGLDDSADDLIIGLGSTVGTTPIISVDENKDVAIPDGALTITTSDNTSQLTLTSTDADENVGPRMDLKRDSSSPAADDYLGQIRWLGEDSAGNSLSYAHMSTYIEDPTDGAEDGKFEIDTRIGGASRSRLLMHSTATVFNQESVDVDFRIESDGKTAMFFVDAGNNRVGIGTSSPSEMLSLDDDTDGEVAVKIQNDSTGSSAYASLFLQGQGNNFKIKNWGDGTSNANATEFVSTAGSSAFFFAPGSSEKVRISNDGDLAVGTSSPDSLVHIAGSGGTAVLRFENPDTGLSTNEVIGKLEFETQDTGGAGVNAYIQAAGNNTSGAAYISFGTGTGGSTTEAARFDSSQRLMIGTTEAITTNTTGKLQMAGTSSATSTFNISRFSADASSATLSFAKSRNASIGGNTVVSSGDNLGSITFHGDDGSDTVTMAAKILGEVDGTPGSNDMPGRLAFFTTPDGDTSPSERVRINCTGDLLHGTTVVPTGVKLGNHLVSSSSTGSEIIAFRKANVSSGNICGALLVGNSDTSGTEDHFVGMWGKAISTNGSMSLHFAAGRSGYEDDTAQVTITSDGELCAGTTTAINDSHTFTVNQVNNTSVHNNTLTSGDPYGIQVRFTGTGSGLGGDYYAAYTQTTGSLVKKFGVAGDGDVTNANNSYGAISDERLKENIVDATNKLDEVKQIKIRNFNFIGDDKKQIGVVAQELETIFPALITEKEDRDADGNKSGKTTKEVKYSVLLPIAIKAIQEQQTLIETLQTKVKALEEA